MRRWEIPLAPLYKGELNIEGSGIALQFMVKAFAAKNVPFFKKGAGGFYTCVKQNIFFDNDNIVLTIFPPIVNRDFVPQSAMD